MIKIYNKLLQEAYFKIVNSFTEIVSLENIELEIKKTNSKCMFSELLESIFKDSEAKFKIELLMMPEWSFKGKCYKVYTDFYTHMRIKKDLLTDEHKM